MSIAPSETTRTDVQIGLVFEDQRTADLRQVIYADSRVVLVRDETGHTTLTQRETFESLLGSRYRRRPDADPDIDGGQYGRLAETLAEYEAADGRKAAHKVAALREALDLLAGRAGDGEETDAEATDDETEMAFEEVPGIGPETAAKLRTQGFVTERDVRTASDDELLAVSGVGPGNLEQIREHLE